MDNNGKKDKTIILWLFALLIAAVPGTFLATFIFDQVAPELLEKLFFGFIASAVVLLATFVLCKITSHQECNLLAVALALAYTPILLMLFGNMAAIFSAMAATGTFIFFIILRLFRRQKNKIVPLVGILVSVMAVAAIAHLTIANAFLCKSAGVHYALFSFALWLENFFIPKKQEKGVCLSGIERTSFMWCFHLAAMPIAVLIVFLWF